MGDAGKGYVRPLVWEGDGHWHSGDNEGWLEEANTPFGWGYSIEFGRSDEGAFIVDSTFGKRLTGFETPDEAKVAAQADYATRILSAIDLDAIRQEARNEALREAAACCDAEADRCDDAAKWGGSKRYVSDCKAAAYAMRDRSRAITDMIEDKT